MAPLFPTSHDHRARVAVRRAADAGFLESYRSHLGDDDVPDREPFTGAERRATVVLWAFLAALALAELAQIFT